MNFQIYRSFLSYFKNSRFKNGRGKIEKLSQQLADDSDRLRVALNAAQMGMWDWNIVTGAITWSPEHELLLGLPLGSFDGKYETFDACLHPDDRERLNQAIAHSMENRVPYRHEYRVIWADGSVHWIEGRGQAFYGEDGKPVRMSGTIMAIDERKQAQLSLEQQFGQQHLISEITQRVRQSLDLQEILQTTVDEVRQFLQVDRVIIFQFSADWGGTVRVESVGDQAFAILPFNIYDPCIGNTYVELFQQGLVTAKADIYTADISPCHVEFLAQFQIRANLVVPILKNGELWGLLVAHHCTAPRQWQDSEIDLLQQIASQVSIALQQATLFKQVQTELLERQQAEGALQERESLLRLFAQYVPAGIAMLDQEMRYVMTSQQWVEDYNLESVESLIGRSHYDLFPEVPERWRQIHQRCLAGEIEKCDDDSFMRADGSQQWVSWEIRPWYTSMGKIGGIVIFSIDVTPRKVAEIALQQFNAELEQRVTERTEELNALNSRLLIALKEQQQAKQEVENLYNAAPCGYHSLDAEGTIVRINDTELSWLGYTRDEVISNMKFIDILTPESRQTFYQHFPQFKQQGWINNLEFQLHHKDGSCRWINLNASAIKDDAGNFVMSRSSLFDITERHKIDQMKQDFISVVSHELRTPLTSIRGSLGLVAGGVYDKKPEKMKAMIAIAARQSDRLVRLVNDILDLRRLESGQSFFKFQQCSAADLIQQSVDVMRSQAEQGQITLSTIPTTAEIWADADAIVQTLTNLLSNAIKFSPPYSTITVTATPHLPTVPSHLSFTLFSVQDQGRGIPADQLDTIFGQFHQVDASDSREKGGTGLGLAICRTIVKQHNGRIWVESLPKQGSTFYFTLPPLQISPDND